MANVLTTNEFCKFTSCSKFCFQNIKVIKMAPRVIGKTHAVSESSTDSIQLGRSELKVSRIGIGTLQWGDPKSGFGESYDEKNLEDAYDTLVDGGINFFDTAEVYGYQNINLGKSSEQLLGRFSKRTSKIPPVVATKFFTIPWTKFLIGGEWRFGPGSMVPALQESLRRMERDQVDLWQIHFPFPTISNSSLMAGLKEAVDLGLTRAVGVSNYDQKQMIEAHKILKDHGIVLASNQVKYNLLSREIEKNGLLEASKELGISIIAYSPLDSGKLTEKILKKDDSNSLKYKSLLNTMAEIGKKHGNKTISQVALSYLLSKGVIPIPGCKNKEQALQHLDVLTWDLTLEEVTALEKAAEKI